MNEPKPWLDEESPPELRRLLLAARRHKPTPAEVQRVMVTLGLASASTALGVRAVVAESGRLASAMGTKWTLLCGGLIGILAGGLVVVGVQHQEAQREAAPVSSIASSSLSRSISPIAPAGSVSASREPRASLSITRSSAALDPSRRQPRSTSVAAPVTSSSPMGESNAHSTLEAEWPTSLPECTPGTQGRQGPAPSASAPAAVAKSESAYIDEARRALVLGDAAESLKILDQYDAMFKKRNFDPEALQLRVRVNVRLGNLTAAQRAAKRLVARYSQTPEGKEARDFLDR